MTIVPAQPDELPLIYQLLQASAEWLHQKKLKQWHIWLNPDTAPPHIKAWVEESFYKNEFFFLKNDTETVGMYRLMYEDKMFWENNPQKAGYIHSFVIKRSFAGNNLGEFMLTEIEKNLKNKEIPFMRLDCNAGNPALCAYYEQKGFVKVGEKIMEWGINNLYEKKI